MTKRMKLIAESDFNQLKRFKHSLFNKAEENIENESHQASSLLENSVIPDDIKLRMYTTLMKSIGKHLQEILHAPVLVKAVGMESVLPVSKNSSSTKASESNESTTEDEDGTSSEQVESSGSVHTLDEVDQQFLRKLPVKCQKKAGDIMRTLKMNPDMITWNRCGEVSFLGEDYESGTSIVDLLSYLVHDLKWSTAPKGTNRFLLCVKRLNIPISLMRAEVRNHLGKEFEFVRDVKSAGDSRNRFMQLKDRLKNWISINDTFDDAEFHPSAHSTPKL